MKILKAPMFIVSNKEVKVAPRKELVKRGTVAVDRCESTPVVWHVRLLRLDVVDRNLEPECYAQFFDYLTGEPVGNPTAQHLLFPSAYEENGILYVIATQKKPFEALFLFESSDLLNWSGHVIFRAPENWSLFNTSLCHSPDGYTIALEIGGEKEIVGNGFTMVFLRSSGSLYNWKVLDPHEAVYTPERYSACPVLRWCGGYYYMIYLESLPLWVFMPYIVRSKDLIHYEVGIRNPVLAPSDDDKREAIPGLLSPDELRYVNETPDINNSDVDLCEYHGKTYLVYSWGTQTGREFLAHADYDGTMEEFLKSYFAVGPDPV